MRHTLREKWQLRLVNVSFVVLFLVIIGLLQWLSREYHLQFDWTQARRHSLTPASIAVVERLKGPLKITAFASQRGETRQLVRDMVLRYQKYRPDIHLEFVDPDTSPERVRKAGIQFDGELQLEYNEAMESLTLTQLNEENFTNALTRLGHRSERWVVFLSGHGERSPDRQANFDLSIWASQLRKRGFKTQSLSLGEHPQIPQNATVLVIAGPRTQLLPGEVREIQNYLQHGGNLMWLNDPGPLYGLEPIAETLGIEFQPGTLVDQATKVITGDDTIIVVTKYGAHPVVRNFTEVTLFPFASGISLNTPQGWQGSVLIDTRPSSWSETGSLDGHIEFNKGADIPGPLNIAVALTRDQEKRQQRVVVFGDGDFLSNSYLGNGGNLDFGMSLTNWLSQDDAYVNIPVQTTRDRQLNLSRPAQIAIALVFLIALPLALATGGVVIWLRRRKR